MFRILIVEDNFMIADLAEECLLANGYDVCGTALNVDEGMALYESHSPDLIMLDLRLGHGQLGTALAARLGSFDKVGILYVTASSHEIALSARDGHACLAKPYTVSDLLRSLELVSDIVATGTALQPFPRGFHQLTGEAKSIACVAS